MSCTPRGGLRPRAALRRRRGAHLDLGRLRLRVEIERRRGARVALPGRPACGCLLDGGHSREERAQIQLGWEGRSDAVGMGGEERRVGVSGCDGNPSSFGPCRPTKIAKIWREKKKVPLKGLELATVDLRPRGQTIEVC